MECRITRVSVGPLIKMFTALYACMGVVFLPLFLIMSLVDPDMRGFGVVFALFLPILYAVLGALSAAIGGALYNWISRGLGGIEVKLDASNPPLDGPQRVSN